MYQKKVTCKIDELKIPYPVAIEMMNHERWSTHRIAIMTMNYNLNCDLELYMHES